MLSFNAIKPIRLVNYFENKIMVDTRNLTNLLIQNGYEIDEFFLNEIDFHYKQFKELLEIQERHIKNLELKIKGEEYE